METAGTELPILGQSDETPCDSCHGGCCRTFVIPLTGADIWKLERDLKKSFWEFACRWEDPHGSIAQKYAPHFHFQDEPKTPFVIGLIQSESTFIPRTTKCQFLREGAPDEEHPLGVARCGIYNSRPSACRVFPTRFDNTGDVVEIVQVPNQLNEDENQAYNLCPRPWEPADFDPVTTMEHLTIAAYEMRFFHKIAQLWNRKPGPWNIFPDFLKIVYSERVMHGEKTLDEELFPTIIKFPAAAESETPSKRAA
ncbi:Flagellin N-methylase [Polystyrenella longa]|uniref:Flagellin N-methylase n=1 Tax=Polystyrenella longa TaxID=2528007 RepID=A0A518CJG3_9PLAN|nr:YkgJ family cysteine cluster protein [Polystyrenella longa]QDU79363.1 Flagellin N-methylase [Polystyrenella longa]